MGYEAHDCRSGQLLFVKFYVLWNVFLIVHFNLSPLGSSSSFSFFDSSQNELHLLKIY